MFAIGEQAWARQALSFPLLLSAMSLFWMGNPSADKMNAFASVYLNSVIGPGQPPCPHTLHPFSMLSLTLVGNAEEKRHRPDILQVSQRCVYVCLEKKVLTSTIVSARLRRAI